MVLSKSYAYFTPEKYLELEWMGPIKHEYLQGQVAAIARVSTGRMRCNALGINNSASQKAYLMMSYGVKTLLSCEGYVVAPNGPTVT